MNLADRNLRILWGSPLPPVHSGVADYAVELLPELARLAEVRVLRPPEWQAPEHWPDEIEMAPTGTPAGKDEIELIHLGNNPYHSWLLPRIRSGNPVVVLHDAVLHHLLVESTEARGDDAALERELVLAHGEGAGPVASARRVGHHGRLDPFLFPARRSFLGKARAVIAHSDWAARTIRREMPEIPVGRVALAVADPGPVDRGESRSMLGIDPQERVLMHLGFLTPEKGLEQILTGFAAAVRMGVASRLVVVGEGRGGELLNNAAKTVGVVDRVQTTGWIEPEFFAAIPAAADLGVVYRTPSAGETSAAALRFLACGVPVAVGGVRQFLEWPEAGTPRLTPGPSAAAELARLLGSIGGDEWISRRRAARSAYEASHRPELVARRLVDLLDELTTV